MAKPKKDDKWVIDCTKEEADRVFSDLDFIDAVLEAVGHRGDADNSRHTLTLEARQKIDAIKDILLEKKAKEV